MGVEEAREKRDHKNDFKKGETVFEETSLQCIERCMHLRPVLAELVKSGKKILLVAHRNLVIHLTSDLVVEEGKLKGDLTTGMNLENAVLAPYNVENWMS